jgi:hypothetical protein
MATTGILRSQIAKRRSPRIALKAPIKLAGEDREKSAFALQATATNLNNHGAAIQLSRELVVGSTVSVRNGRGNEAAARVIAQVGGAKGTYTYGVEFLHHDDVKDFWGIRFPSTS